ncbi:MAG: hypothetical protein J6S67_22335 [Methanobrevibacter sp.]|nr:hypothetical protein [Methanobrevibacter sp.]
MLKFNVHSLTPVKESGGGGGTGGTYRIMQRVKDDSNNEIGTVCGFFIDSDDNEYAVVCLDAVYRAAALQVCDYGNSLNQYRTIPVIDIPMLYCDNTTATANTTDMLNAAVAWAADVEQETGEVVEITSPAANFCRSKQFTIGGVTYYGQLPTFREIMDIMLYYTEINNADPTASSNPDLAFGGHEEPYEDYYAGMWTSSTGWNGSACLKYGYQPDTTFAEGQDEFFVAPILELPNQ